MTQCPMRNMFLILFLILISACKPEFSAPCCIEINGFEVLGEGHLFQGKDSLVAISSWGGMDIIAVFKTEEGQENLHIKVSNPTDSAIEINSLEVHMAKVKGENYLWRWQNSGTKEAPKVSLQLSGSSIILLPEERISLPPLQFFSHLCSDKDSP